MYPKRRKIALGLFCSRQLSVTNFLPTTCALATSPCRLQHNSAIPGTSWRRLSLLHYYVHYVWADKKSSSTRIRLLGHFECGKTWVRHLADIPTGRHCYSASLHVQPACAAYMTESMRQGFSLTPEITDRYNKSAAYQYDDDTSSDSDDEVLKHYQGLKSTGSVRSSRSGRSKRSAKSGKSAAAQSVRSAKTDRSKRASLDDADGDRASLAEQGLVATKDLSSDEGEQDRHTSHGTESPLVPHSIAGDTTGASEVAGSEAGATSRAGDRVTYENRAFSAELAVSGSLSGSEQGLSAYRLSNDVSTGCFPGVVLIGMFGLRL
ncbi:hypothetical protein BaRGS_00021653 [Batillaria attramentaria]|uniref:Uncharacterized protein n=1 Tax=Batillaria attramentaria TaxID=370345 RepID=A0ABD0KJK0_9CAEN